LPGTSDTWEKKETIKLKEMDYSHRENQKLKNKETKNTKQNNENPKQNKKKKKKKREERTDYTVLYRPYTIE